MPCLLWFLRQRFGRQPVSARMLVKRNGTQGSLGPRPYPARPCSGRACGGRGGPSPILPARRLRRGSAVHRPSETRKTDFQVRSSINESPAALGTDGHRVACARASSARRTQANARDLVDDIFQFGGMTFMSAMPERMCRLGFHQRLACHASSRWTPSTLPCESALSPMPQRAIIAHDVHLGIYSSRGG
jgi:hypothetical protein